MQCQRNTHFSDPDATSNYFYNQAVALLNSACSMTYVMDRLQFKAEGVFLSENIMVFVRSSNLWAK